MPSCIFSNRRGVSKFVDRKELHFKQKANCGSQCGILTVLVAIYCILQPMEVTNPKLVHSVAIQFPSPNKQTTGRNDRDSFNEWTTPINCGVPEN